MPEIFLGREEESDAHFLILEDCSHMFEVQDMDMYMASNTDTVKLMRCPLCQVPIRRSLRYGQSVKTALCDIETAKVYFCLHSRSL